MENTDSPCLPFSLSPCLCLLDLASTFALELRVRTGVDVADHVQVVMVDVDDFFGLFVPQRVRHGPADAANVFVVDRAFVVSVMLLRRADERIHARRIDVVGDLVS